MHSPDRREFLGTTLGGLTALAAGLPLFGKDWNSSAKEDAPLDTLFEVDPIV